jgi:hypothetical protein
VAGSVRENVRLRRGFRLAAPRGLVGAYLHGRVGDSLGRIAGLVALEAEPALEGPAAEQAQVRGRRGLSGALLLAAVRQPQQMLLSRKGPGGNLAKELGGNLAPRPVAHPPRPTRPVCPPHPWRLCPQDLAGKLAMQVVGAAPRYLDRAAVPAEALAAEASLLREQALKSGGGGGE